MIRDFGIVWTERGLLLDGLANTANRTPAMCWLDRTTG